MLHCLCNLRVLQSFSQSGTADFTTACTLLEPASSVSSMFSSNTLGNNIPGTDRGVDWLLALNEKPDTHGTGKGDVRVPGHVCWCGELRRVKL
jgi:hypothetical protein